MPKIRRPVWAQPGANDCARFLAVFRLQAAPGVGFSDPGRVMSSASKGKFPTFFPHIPHLDGEFFGAYVIVIVHVLPKFPTSPVPHDFFTQKKVF
ncbi:MAG: hypothetical protein ACKN9W_03880 [Methylococcus sp.]